MLSNFAPWNRMELGPASHCDRQSAWQQVKSPTVILPQLKIRRFDLVTPPPIWKRSIVMSVYVCVCLSVRDHIFRTARPIFTNTFVHVTYGRGSVMLWQRSDTLCMSGFVDDVKFAHKLRLLDVAAQLKRNAHAALGLAIKCAQ